MKTLLFLLLLVPGSFYFPAHFSAPTNTSLDIGNNYWMFNGMALFPPSSSPAADYWTDFNFTASAAALSLPQPVPSWLTCGDDDFAKKKNPQPQSILSGTDSCGNAFGAVFLWEQNMENFGAAYDTMRWYIMHCYANANAGQTWSAYQGSWSVEVETQTGRDTVFNFILYALGLRSDNEWFCDGVSLLGIKFNSGGGHGVNYRADRAIDQFLMNNPRCAFDYRNDSIDYVDLLMAQENLWADTASAGEVFDTSIPTLHDLGLDTLLKINGQAGVTYALPTPSVINSASITENPFDNSTSIALSIGREAYITIAVYNVLGQQIVGAGYAGVFEQGSRTIPLDMTNAPPGTYLVRISTSNNETQTLKLTKE